jgi:hypothetical protein
MHNYKKNGTSGIQTPQNHIAMSIINKGIVHNVHAENVPDSLVTLSTYCMLHVHTRKFSAFEYWMAKL